ncbi:MAG TPA: 2OG-Fe(II) oxygenase family protein [Burkholderiaceae bacterium]|nr:2OG-Fe(II) oxygenase family protein [Burkholderiaceae bacterium]
MFALTSSILEEAAARYARAGRVLVRDVIDAPVAQQISKILLTELDWELTTRFQGETRNVATAKLKQMSEEQRAQLRQAILRGAKQDFQFEFLEYSLGEANLATLPEGHALKQLSSALRGDAGHAFFRRLLGIERIAHVTAFASRYESGHFLMPHTDHVKGEQREAAFVLNLSPRWKPEWGGLLQFIGPRGDVEETFLPHHNTLSLFKVPQAHMVSYITPLAESPRLSIAGWIYSELPGDTATRYG